MYRCMGTSSPVRCASGQTMDPPPANTSVAARLLYEDLHRECQQLRQTAALQEEATLEAQRAAGTLEATLVAQKLANDREVSEGHEALAAAAKREHALAGQLDQATCALRATQALLEEAQTKALDARKKARADAEAREHSLREALQATRDAVRAAHRPLGWMWNARPRRLPVCE
jgi:hypothetical protein